MGGARAPRKIMRNSTNWWVGAGLLCAVPWGCGGSAKTLDGGGGSRRDGQAGAVNAAGAGNAGGGNAGAGSGGGAMSSAGGAVEVGGGASEAGRVDAGDAGATSGGAGGTPGRSLGCQSASSSPVSMGAQFVTHTVKVPGVNAIYQPGGVYAMQDGELDYTNRPYAVRVPEPYQPIGTAPYAVTFELGSCGSSQATKPAYNFGFPPLDYKHQGIEVALLSIDVCFRDGGPAIGNRDDSPEIAYFRAVLADIEERFCIDTSKVFVSGTMGGAYSAYTLGCAAADVVRGVTAFEGGMRAVRPTCTGPMAAMLVAPTNNPNIPIGPLDASDPKYIELGSPGSAPGRDDLLHRNGCIGDATAPWNPVYPACVKYTGCPAAYPVVWCPIAGAVRNPSNYNNVTYAPGGMWDFLTALPGIPAE